MEELLREKEALLQRQADLLSESEEKLARQADALERQLIASGRLVPVRELTASMAHELNNPLGIILGFAQERLGEIDASDPSYRTLQIINEEATRCEMVVRDLVDFARPATPEFIRADLKEIIEKALHSLSRRFDTEKVKVHYDAEPDIPEIYADPQQLQQALLILCSNAVDAMPAGGLLNITAKLAIAERVDLVVADTGFGIDAADLSQIFHPFFTARKRRGLGLGLAICARIIKAHGGSIDVVSRINEGTAFSLRLPLNRLNAPHPPAGA
jgi:two-component system NtrC family sensor kinase